MYGVCVLGSMPASSILTTPGSLGVFCGSWRNFSFICGCICAIAGLSTLIATFSPVYLCSAKYTHETPPSPISLRTLYLLSIICPI